MTQKKSDILLGLGGQRCGSSWLYEMVSQHASIVPARGDKETHFFDRNWERGEDWYKGLWSQPLEADQTRWECTPNYLYLDDAPKRIAATLPDARFLILLRDPVGRSLSHYRRYQVNSGQSMGFDAALAKRPSILKYSDYAPFLRAYFDEFGRDRFYVGFYEDIARRPAALFADILAFSGLAEFDLPQGALQRRVNAVRQPRNAAVYGAVYKAKRWLSDQGLESVVSAARRAGALKLVSSKTAAIKINETIDPHEMQMLERLRDEQIKALAVLGINASHWAQAKLAPPAALTER